MYLPELGDVLRDAIVECKPAPVAELHNGNRGERFRDRAIVEDRPLGHRLTRRAIGKAMFMTRDDAAIAHDKNARAHNFVVVHRSIE
jgi:hypothetical protein